ncbi:MAG: DUF6049 family protein [Acidimicrobiaceae bacterium]|nr:DUF6049 family protein [Acidimicrobiaceae bacterium]
MTRRTRLAAALAALALVLSAALAPLATITPHAAAQTDGRIDLVAQTAFVGDDPATIDLRVIGPADARIRIQIYQALTTREEIHASYDGVTGRPFSDFSCNVDQPLTDGPCQLDSTETFTIEIPDHEIGEILRINQGALPVVITLVDSDGDTLDTLTTYLLVLNEPRGSVFHVAFFADLTAPLAVQPDQTISLDTEDLLARARQISARPDIPVTVAIQPETLQTLATNSNEQLAELAELLTDRPVLNAPWVELDEEAWRLTGDTPLIAEQYRYGADVIAETLGRRPTNISILDDSATPETLALLRSLGTEAVIVEPTQVIRNPSALDEFAPLAVRDSNGATTPAIARDTVLRRATSPTDPELAGHRALVELAIEADNATADKAIMFRFEGWRPAELDVLTDGFDQRSNLRLSPLSEALGVPVARNTAGQPIQTSLQPPPAPDMSQRSADIAVTRGTVDAYASMVAPARTPVTALETLLRAAASSSLNDEQSAVYTLNVFDAVLTGTAGITVEPAERITLTDRQADLRITIRNGQPLPITVDLLLSAEKLRFPDGERSTRTLAPGDNEITVRVETLASGDARVTVAITSPGGRLELHEGTIDIRSTAISGLGLVISIIALIVLGGWWVRTIRRVRRNCAAATVAATAQSADAEATPEATPEEPVDVQANADPDADADEQSTQPQPKQTQPTQHQQNQEEP